MGNILENLAPNRVFYFFEALSNIPRGSGNEKAVSDYCVTFAKERNLSVIQDEVNNVIIKKPATKGYEDAPTIIIQAHLDMVCEKNLDTEHDFINEPIHLVVEGDFVHGKGTTLGADDGIGVAYGLALLDSSDIAHPALEIILTVDEEVGMKGAEALDLSSLEGRILLNIDSDVEGEFLVSCAGGLKASIALPIIPTMAEGRAYKVSVKGLKGGHSGVEIDKNRGNAIKLLGRVLYELNKELNIGIFDIYGGLKDNAIPREAISHLIISEDDIQLFENKIQEIDAILRAEHSTSDPNLAIGFEPINEVEREVRVLGSITKEKLIFILMLVPNGVQTMSADIQGLVESSTNLGVIRIAEEEVQFSFAVRSSVGSRKALIKEQLEYLAELMGAEFSADSDYPEWAYRKDSRIRELFIQTYKEINQEEPRVQAIHAGLECGILGKKLDDLDMISFGPNAYDIHTPEERLSISSTERVWNFLVKVMENTIKL